MTGYVYIAGTVLLTVYGQLVLKWQATRAGALPGDALEKLEYVARLLVSPWVISA